MEIIVPDKSIRTFMIYETLYDILVDYVMNGDGVTAVPVFDEEIFPESNAIDCSVINFVKFISTAFGLVYVEEAMAIVKDLKAKKAGKETLRFRSDHPLFVSGGPEYQNVCLISGMIHLGIPILPYFDGEEIVL